MTFRLTCVLLLSACAPVAAVAQPVAAGAGPVTYGPGHKLCSDWSAAEIKPDPSEYMANRFFVAGMMSAYNIYASPAGYDIGRGQTPDDMKSFMHDRCAAHPTETIATATAAYLAKLKQQQG